MKVTWQHVGLVFAGIAAASVGFLAKRQHLETGFVSTGKTEVRIKATVRGVGGRPVKNSKISVFDPEQIILGHTNEDGLLESRALLSSGKSVILQADGIAFKMRRNILIPRSNHYQASVFFDLAEVHEGNATLISSNNSESTSLVSKPTPRPTWLELDFLDLKLEESAKSNLTKSIKLAEESMQNSAKIKLSCQTWQETPPVNECRKEQLNKETHYFLVTQFPGDEKETASWLTFIQTLENFSPSTPIGRDEARFVIRHGNHKIRAYLGDRLLSPWKTKPGSTTYRASAVPSGWQNGKVDLTVLTEGGQVLQKKVTWPPNRKVIVTRIPFEKNMNLSQRKE